MIVDLGRPMLVDNSYHSVGVISVHGHCHDGMARGDARIVRVVFGGVAWLLAEEPAPKAALNLWLARPIGRVIRVLLCIAPDHSGRDLGSLQILNGSFCG